LARRLRVPNAEPISGTVIRLHEVTCRDRADRVVVDRLSLAVNSGEVYCLLGSRGAGKTAVIDLILGFRQPSSGSLSVADKNPAEEPVKRLVAHVTTSSLYPSQSALENLRLLFALSGAVDRVADIKYRNALRRFGVADRHIEGALWLAPPEVPVAVCLAAAHLRKVPAVVLDDPAANLDSRAAVRFAEGVKLLRGFGAAVLLATSDASLAAQVSDTVALLKNGVKVAERRKAEFSGDDMFSLVSDYLGSAGSAS
jgi:ABC-2 type transport system ATP-binding protein